ncbi:alpha/beta fold hydrolase [Nocardia salmonicida]
MTARRCAASSTGSASRRCICSGIRTGYISGLDALGAPDLVDDRADLPALTLVVLDDSGDLRHLEEPERFAEAVRNFVLPTASLSGGETTDGNRT